MANFRDYLVKRCFRNSTVAKYPIAFLWAGLLKGICAGEDCVEVLFWPEYHNACENFSWWKIAIWPILLIGLIVAESIMASVAVLLCLALLVALAICFAVAALIICTFAATWFYLIAGALIALLIYGWVKAVGWCFKSKRVNV